MSCIEPSCVYHSKGECTMAEESFRNLCPYFDWDDTDLDEEDDDEEM